MVLYIDAQIDRVETNALLYLGDNLTGIGLLSWYYIPKQVVSDNLYSYIRPSHPRTPPQINSDGVDSWLQYDGTSDREEQLLDLSVQPKYSLLCAEVSRQTTSYSPTFVRQSLRYPVGKFLSAVGVFGCSTDFILKSIHKSNLPPTQRIAMWNKTMTFMCVVEFLISMQSCLSNCWSPLAQQASAWL